MIDKKIFKATHQGPLKIADKELLCAVLENGKRIISMTAIFRAFGRTQRGRKKDEIRVLNMPSFIDANNLQPFIDEGLRDKLMPIEYYSTKGVLMAGYEAEILPLLCEVYLSAREGGVLTKRQLPLAMASEILVRNLSKVGIIALVDEATGYQAERDRDELQKLLAIYLSEERLKWAKMFPDEYYRQLFRLRKWNYSPLDTKRPQVVGKYTNQLVYEKLPPAVLEELRKLNPVKNKSTHRRGAAHFQFLSSDIGQPDLRNHLLQLITVMRISSDWPTFISNFKKAFPTPGDQLELEFDDVEEKDK